ncbi:minor histocompatibility antigen H13 [Lepeophtheirus salmonis]|nr:minor histocompatibility antigen H13-like [Lepeophtheirus salmonis]XP_040574023.1 minor histocompatibility antigen H13-like [Lepeophtheirus salmonis]
MAELESNITEALNATLSKGTKVPATLEGTVMAYGALLIMALVPIFFGSFRSVDSHKEQVENSERTGEKPETMTSHDAAMFPFIASSALFGLYIFFQIFSKDNINLLLSAYFFVLGVLALTKMISPFLSRNFLSFVPKKYFVNKFTMSDDEAETNLSYLMDAKFSSHDIVALALSSVLGVWYLFKKHWIANNIFGLAFAINGIELLHLNNVMTGCILLGGLFFYDVFWVFGTNVMVTVATNFEAPIKLVFPQDLMEKGVFGASNMAMLGLGDIVIPGIFVALLLRYDRSLNRKSNFYFYTCFIAYVLGLLTTIGVMHTFKHAQPALLYLSPACTGIPILVALIRGDVKSMFQYKDHPDKEEKGEKNEKKNE